MELIHLIMPTLISLFLYERIYKKMTNYERIQKYVIFFFLNNLIIFGFLYIQTNNYLLFNLETYTPSMMIKLYLLEIVVALTIGWIACYLKKNIKQLKNKLLLEIKNKKNIKHYILKYLLIFLIFLVFQLMTWIPETFGSVTFSQIMFTLTTSITGTEESIINSFLTDCLLYSLSISIIVTIVVELIRLLLKAISQIIIEKKINKIITKILKIFTKIIHTIIYLVLIIVLIVNIINVAEPLGVIEYYEHTRQTTSLYEDNYVDASTVDFSFPDEKRNIIFIQLESMETSVFSTEEGGIMSENYSPYLYQLALDNVNFKQDYEVGGYTQVSGTGWTVAGITSQLLGIPINIPIDGNTYGSEDFLPGAYGMGDILAAANYNTVAVMGSDSTFGNRNTLLQNHGDFEIIDLYGARELGYIPEDYSVWWGYEDSIVYEIAKDQLDELSKEEEPFFLYMLSSNQHFEDGYLEESCPITEDEQLENVYLCADLMIKEFIDYLKSQNYYENTTIVITGDHLSMNTTVFPILDEIALQIRRGYFAILNGTEEYTNDTSREYTSFDILPTALQSIGVEWDSDSLALGTSLYSSESTLLERYGSETLNKELMKNSDYYNDELLK